MTETPFENDGLEESAKWTARRRTILKASAWAVPAMVAVTATPAAAASTDPVLDYTGFFSPTAPTITAPASAFDPVTGQFLGTPEAFDAWWAAGLDQPLVFTAFLNGEPLQFAELSFRINTTDQFLRFRSPQTSNIYYAISDEFGVVTLPPALFQFTASPQSTPLPESVMQVWFHFPHTAFIEQVPINFVPPAGP